MVMWQTKPERGPMKPHLLVFEVLCGSVTLECGWTCALLLTDGAKVMEFHGYEFVIM